MYTFVACQHHSNLKTDPYHVMQHYWKMKTAMTFKSHPTRCYCVSHPLQILKTSRAAETENCQLD